MEDTSAASVFYNWGMKTGRWWARPQASFRSKRCCLTKIHSGRDLSRGVDELLTASGVELFMERRRLLHKSAHLTRCVRIRKLASIATYRHKVGSVYG